MDFLKFFGIVLCDFFEKKSQVVLNTLHPLHNEVLKIWQKVTKKWDPFGKKKRLKIDRGNSLKINVSADT